MTSTNTHHPLIAFFTALEQTQSALQQQFDRKLNGIRFTEFLILFTLSQAEETALRRVDLAKAVGLTPSGITRLLLPMEKIHLVKSGPTESDARVRLVQLTPAGQEKLTETIDRLTVFAEDLPKNLQKNAKNLTPLLTALTNHLN